MDEEDVENMTAISMLYTMQQFLMAADGRCRADNPEQRELETDQAQKIFLVDGPMVKMAWALAGFALNDDGTFDTAAETRHRIEALPALGFSSAHDYIHRLCLNIRRSVIRARKDGRIQEFPKNEHLVGDEKDRKFRLFFVGYFKGKPFWIEAGFYHDEEKDHIDIRIVHRNVDRANLNCIGPTVIAEMMYRGDVAPDARLAGYKKSERDGPLEYVTSVIKAYSDPAASEIDAACGEIGGHIHVAEVTTNAARWMIEPLRP